MSESSQGAGGSKRPLAHTELGTGPTMSAPANGAPPEPDTLPGTTLNELYRIETRIGQGGMGNVYAATHVHLGKRFAVKVLSSNVSNNQVSVERLKAEAVAASSIDHENIVQVVSFDSTEQGMVFIVMELLEGRSLAEVAAQGALDPVGALRIVLPVCDALEAAHSHGIVHRDLKPENIFLARKSGREIPKVLDFGISKIKAADAEQVRLTRTGQLVGTPLYMSPEQAKGEPLVDHRADIYALGVILYELVTGAPPFQGSNYFQLLWKHGNEPPVPPRQRSTAADIPPLLDETIMRALAKDPDKRFQSARELGDALGDCLVELGEAPASSSSAENWQRISSRHHIKTARKRRGMVLWGIVALVLGASSAWIFLDPASPLASDKPTPVAAKAKTSSPPIAPPHVPEPPPVVVTGVNFSSTPPGATVTVDGEKQARLTPMVAPLPVSEKALEVRFEKAGYGAKTVEVTISKGLAPVEVKLERVRKQPARVPALREHYE